mmetsp:Transcript_9915/g.30512  ORF Transcript_9915/g.30512 Transcript_9915/m.30512 type:complete len:536 (+) Transcript_9915:42-1649(+)
MASAAAVPRKVSNNSRVHHEHEKQDDVRLANIEAAKAVADTVRTSLGPMGMDKMIVHPSGEVTTTNDGATLLSHMKLIHPAAKMLVELSKAQDIEAGDGTTSVVVLAGALLGAASNLLAKGLHPTTISNAFQMACLHAQKHLRTVAQPVLLSNRDELLQSAITSLNSKIVSQYSSLIAPLAVDAVLRVIDPETAVNVDLNSDIRVVKHTGGTIDDTELVDGLVFTQRLRKSAGGPGTVKNAKIALIQFQLSPPKPNMDHSVVISDYNDMDRILRQEKKYILELVKQIKKSGANVLLIQKSILRDAVSELALFYLAKLKIMVVTDVERADIEFVTKCTGCTPIASIEALSPEKLGTAGLVEEVSTGSGRLVKITGVRENTKTVSVLVRGSNKATVDEVDRSLHDALCVIRSLVKEKFMLPGGGAPEAEISLALSTYAKTLTGKESYAVRAYADALEVIPSTLAENAGLSPIEIVTELRNRHAAGDVNAGINVRKGTITDMRKENVVQPLLVSSSALNLATETVNMILKIDDILSVR